MRFDDLQVANKKRNAESFPCSDWIGTDWGNAIAGEVGELCNLIKKHRRGDVIEVSDIGKEIADVVIYADLLAQYFNLDMGLYVANKFNEVSERVGSKIKLSPIDEVETELFEANTLLDYYKEFVEGQGLTEEFEEDRQLRQDETSN